MQEHFSPDAETAGQLSLRRLYKEFFESTDERWAGIGRGFADIARQRSAARLRSPLARGFLKVMDENLTESALSAVFVAPFLLSMCTGSAILAAIPLCLFLFVMVPYCLHLYMASEIHDSLSPLAQSSANACSELRELIDQSPAIRAYVEAAIDHRDELLMVDLRVARTLRSRELRETEKEAAARQAERDAEKNHAACVQLHGMAAAHPGPLTSAGAD